MLTIVRPGLLTLIQDGGRWGWQHLGVPVSGPMDPFSFRLANRLVGNADHEAALEITMKGPEVGFQDGALIAIAGAHLTARLSGVEVPINTPVSVQREQVLTFGERRRGARAYLAVRGGLDVPVVLGSRSSSIQAGLPGLAGRALRAGDVVAVGGRAQRPISPDVRVDDTPHSRRPAVLRVLAGPDDARFSRQALARFFMTIYKLSVQSNRMGYRLEGSTIALRDGGQMLSEASPLGSVQVPPSGEPILLMADRQTTGGYARIATVITADLPVAGQLAPGEELRFEECSQEAALMALQWQEAFLRQVGRVAS